MKRVIFFASVAAALVLQGVSNAHAVTIEEFKCRSTMSKSLSKYSKTLSKYIVACHKARDIGAVPGTTDCNDMAQVSAYSGTVVDDASATAQENIVQACTGVSSILALYPDCPAPFGTLDDGGTTTGIDNFNEVGVCAMAHTNLLASGMANDILGSPGAVNPDLVKCHHALAQAYTKAVLGIIKTRAKCQTAADKASSSLDYVCASNDPGGKVQDALDKAAATIDKACLELGATVSALESCATTAADLGECVATSVEEGSGDLAALFYKLSAGCPGGVSYKVVVAPGAAVDEGFDIGVSGGAHDVTAAGGGLTLDVSCDEECANCSVSSVAPETCRCRADSSTTCTTNTDCGGGGICDCMDGPPTPLSVSGAPLCVVRKTDGTMSGTYDGSTEDVSVHMPVRVWTYLGIDSESPCPKCTGGFCAGGARNGLACTVDSADPDFGDMSYDCMPSSFANVSGGGTRATLDFTTATTSMDSPFACSAPYDSLDCACAYCSGDTTLACHSDADCAGAGTCSSLTGIETRKPNNCGDLTCTVDAGDVAGEGTCAAGPATMYCDGRLRAGGHGVYTCSSNDDCAFAEPCDGGGCGNCTVSQKPDCFLDTITAQGTAGSTMVGTGCVSPASSPSVTVAMGLPGPIRLKHAISQTRVCTDGVTPFVPPDGATCP